jgi:hypothetical protein
VTLDLEALMGEKSKVREKIFLSAPDPFRSISFKIKKLWPFKVLMLASRL